VRNEKEIKEIAAFFRKMYFPAKRWPWKQLYDWLRWYDGAAGLLVCRWGKKIKGIALARTIATPVEGFKEYSFDPNGKVVWVESIASQYPEVFRTLGRQIKQRFEKCNQVAFSREKNGSGLKIYDMNKIARKLT